MCWKDDWIDSALNVSLWLIIIIPVLYLVYIYIIKKRKKFKYFLFAVFAILLLLFIRRVIEINKCVYGEGEIPASSEIPTTSVKTTTVKKDDENITSKGYRLEKKDGAYYIDGYLIVNKSYALDSDWVPQNPHSKINDEICKSCIDETAYSAWISMQSDASAIGLNIYIASGYRSYNYQEGLYQSYVNRDGKEAADTYSARAGHSEHQSGLAFDLNSVDQSFAATNEGKWIHSNASLYGFIIRYPKDKTNETGYKYEPWHLRYVGKELADKLFVNNEWITMEAYFGLDSKYS